ncbi:MAG: ABC transporter substrate-binding protein [Ardenticatenales bacterium]|nr:ABC transporter substrate-binding protein [Ardenticatenales bacterium]
MFRKVSFVLLCLMMGVLMSGCGGGGSEPTAEPESGTVESTAVTAAATTRALRPVTLAMGYIPNVQFAPFYVAVEKGYFADEGIELTFDYGMENDLVQLVAANELQFAIASGDQVMLGRSRGLPVRYVANWYRRFPVAIASLKHDLSDPKVLEGKTLGLPGLFGANYIGWLAVAHAAGINADAVRLEAIGFNQVPILVEEKVDAVVVYATNEPLQLTDQGYEPNVIMVADFIDLVANGLITNDVTIENDPELVQGMVRAMLRGIEDTLADPDGAFAIVSSERWVPEAGGDNAEMQRAVLEASLPFWQNETPGIVPGTSWESSQQFMLDAGLLDKTVPLDELYTDEFTGTSSE